MKLSAGSMWLIGLPALLATGIVSLLCVIPSESIAAFAGKYALCLLLLVELIGWLSTVSFRQPRTSGCIFVGGSLILIPGVLLALIFFGSALEPRFWTFGQLYRHMKPGMTHAETYALIARDYPESGRRQRPRIFADRSDRMMLFMHSEKPPTGHSAESISLFFEDDRLARKEYAPD